MEFETINKETPEMKQLISGIKTLSKRVRDIAQPHRPLFDENSTSLGERSAKGFSLALAPYRTIGTRAYFPTLRLQGRFSIGSPI